MYLFILARSLNVSVYSWNFLLFTVEELPAIVGELKNKFKDDFGIDFDNGKCSFETERNERNVLRNVESIYEILFVCMRVCHTDDEESVMGKLKQVAIDRLKEEGVEIDTEDSEKTKKSIIQRAKAYFGVSRKSKT